MATKFRPAIFRAAGGGTRLYSDSAINGGGPGITAHLGVYPNTSSDSPVTVSNTSTIDIGGRATKMVCIMTAPKNTNLAKKWTDEDNVEYLPSGTPVTAEGVPVMPPPVAGSSTTVLGPFWVTAAFVTVETLNVRSQPTTVNSPVVGTLKLGQKILDLQSVKDTDWAYSKAAGGFFCVGGKSKTYLSQNPPTKVLITKDKGGTPTKPGRGAPESIPEAGVVVAGAGGDLGVAWLLLPLAALALWAAKKA